jgi:hypothetical protein
MILAAAVGGNRDVLECVRAMLRAQVTPECSTAELFVDEDCAIAARAATSWQ